MLGLEVGIDESQNIMAGDNNNIKHRKLIDISIFHLEFLSIPLICLFSTIIPISLPALSF